MRFLLHLFSDTKKNTPTRSVAAGSRLPVAPWTIQKTIKNQMLFQHFRLLARPKGGLTIYADKEVLYEMDQVQQNPASAIEGKAYMVKALRPYNSERPPKMDRHHRCICLPLAHS